MLKVRNLHVFYGGIHALKGISFNIAEGQIVTLLGANGAGKSTTLRTVCGFVIPKEGDIFFEGRNIIGLPPYEIVKLGIALVPEGRRVFPNLTVLENLLLGAHSRKDSKRIRSDLEWIFSLFPVLEERTHQLAGTLSGGEQQMLAIGRALMSRPKLLMMDEPSLGLAPIIARQIFNVIKQLSEEGNTILLVEQNALAALQIADYAYVLETGRIALEGPATDIINNDEVRKAYLGGE
ncbi:MAG: ABC transporter ATP-binding protein [Conexivisphaerales archaeon]